MESWKMESRTGDLIINGITFWTRRFGQSQQRQMEQETQNTHSGATAHRGVMRIQIVALLYVYILVSTLASIWNRFSPIFTLWDEID